MNKESCGGLVFQVSGAGALKASRPIRSPGLVPKTSSAFNRHLRAVSNTLRRTAKSRAPILVQKTPRALQLQFQRAEVAFSQIVGGRDQRVMETPQSIITMMFEAENQVMTGAPAYQLITLNSVSLF